MNFRRRLQQARRRLQRNPYYSELEYKDPRTWGVRHHEEGDDYSFDDPRVGRVVSSSEGYEAYHGPQHLGTEFSQREAVDAIKRVHRRQRSYYQDIVDTMKEEDEEVAFAEKWNARRNPHGTAPAMSGNAVERYKAFHGTEPDDIREGDVWLPGDLVEVGARAVDIGYRAHNTDSNKGPHNYVHDFGGGVKCYRRAKKGEKVDLSYGKGEFPDTLIVCGTCLGFSIEANGKLKETKTKSKKLVGGPDTKGYADLLAIVDGKGNVQYIFRGGTLSVADWLYN